MLARILDRSHDEATASRSLRLIEFARRSRSGKLCGWAKWNGRIRGMKVHVVYDPQHDLPRIVEITPRDRQRRADRPGDRRSSGGRDLCLRQGLLSITRWWTAN